MKPTRRQRKRAKEKAARWWNEAKRYTAIVPERLSEAQSAEFVRLITSPSVLLDVITEVPL